MFCASDLIATSVAQVVQQDLMPTRAMDAIASKCGFAAWSGEFEHAGLMAEHLRQDLLVTERS